MKLKQRRNAAQALLVFSILYADLSLGQGSCPSPGSCGPCGEFITNLPMPSYDSCGVQPLQNYVATYESCLRSGWNGIYLGTGFGYGEIDYNLRVPGIVLKEHSNSYITEYVTLGYAHSSSRFFIAGELGYYYNSVTSPIYYEDPSSFVFTAAGPPPSVVTVTPCSVRLDINAQNHFALDLMPGFLATPRLTIFSRLGFEYTSYSWVRRICFPQVTSFNFMAIPFAAIADDEDIGDKETDSVVDFRLGAGISFTAGPHVSFNVNYIHIFGSKATFTPDTSLILDNAPIVLDAMTFLPVPGTLASNINTLAAQNSIDPDRNEILFGVTFSF